MSKKDKKTNKNKVQAAVFRDGVAVQVGAHINPQWQAFGASHAGKCVTPETALQLSAVWACVRLLSQTVSTLPIKLYRKQNDTRQSLENAHFLWQLFKIAPNKDQTPAKLFEFLIASMLLRGNAYFEKRIIGSRTVALLPILPQAVEGIKRLDNGQYEYTFTRDGVRHVLPETHIWHIRGFGLDGFLGLPSVQVGANVFGSATAADEAAGKIFASGMSASGFLTHENGYLKNEQREKLRQSLSEFSGSKNAGKVMVLEAGLKYQGITLNPEAAQLLESRAFGIEEICRWFGVPPVLIGHTSASSTWGASIEALFQLFVTTGLRPLLINIEQSIKKDLLHGLDKETVQAEFNVEGLLRGDTAARTQYYSAAVNNGWLSRNDVRALENLPAVDGGEVLTVQSALIPLQDVGKNYE
ncbi:phage portal protein [Kingella kingae]|uniref:phage portal protein n=2 Tax=Kingella kingae TaxID=504 RepID=UPI00254C9219|nr:phage portal protein [Kingella kingae]MDK4545151.1 phage portal protein [Kingella kingae]MDK4612551.1 phage portal protein [Kingella kingae]MDK4614681.1 phage portal protein [Kingella kingae]MDK4617014.1 phage portal protein [Kingella kingae]MDK4620934.1 phage portal protein [Kingella kingae]